MSRWVIWGLLLVCVAACAEEHLAPPLAFPMPRDGGRPPTLVGNNEGDDPPRTCRVASDCDPIPCDRVQCVDGECMKAPDRLTKLNALDGNINDGPCGEGYACGPGIPTPSSCCEESCPNGCGGPKCACSSAECVGVRTAQYCCGGVINGKSELPAAPKCKDASEPPCSRL